MMYYINMYESVDWLYNYYKRYNYHLWTLYNFFKHWNLVNFVWTTSLNTGTWLTLSLLLYTYLLPNIHTIVIYYTMLLSELARAHRRAPYTSFAEITSRKLKSRRGICNLIYSNFYTVASPNLGINLFSYTESLTFLWSSQPHTPWINYYRAPRHGKNTLIHLGIVN